LTHPRKERVGVEWKVRREEREERREERKDTYLS